MEKNTVALTQFAATAVVSVTAPGVSAAAALALSVKVSMQGTEQMLA